MAQNLLPNDGPGAKFALWTPTCTGSGTVPVGTYSATGGADSLADILCSCTGTSGGIELVATVNVEQESALLAGFVGTSSSSSANIVPFVFTFLDGAATPNTIVAYTPVASAASTASAVYYQQTVFVPDGAVACKIAIANLLWSSTGGYTIKVQSPVVLAL